MLDVETIKKDFPMLNGKTMNDKPLVYLDNGATTFKPKQVIETVNHFYNDITSNIHRGDYEIAYKADVAYDHCRETIAKFINCEPKEVVFTSGASASLNMAAYSCGLCKLKKDDVILITEAEHASNVLPWFRVAEKTGAKVEYIPLTQEGRISIENFEAAMDERVRIVAVASVTNVLGYIAPVKQICEIAHKYGAIVVVDGAQSVPHMPTDVKEWDCDLLAFSGHKMIGPSGVGVLYGKYQILQEMEPMMLGGGANSRFDVCGNVLLKEAPFKFEAGTPNIEGVMGLDAAAQYLMNIGMANITEYEKELHAYMTKELSKLDNVIVYNPNGDSGIVAFNVKDIFSQDAAGYLNSQGVAVRSGNHCAKILVNFLKVSDTIRASLYLYNTKADVDALIEALKTCTIENCIGTFF